MEKLEHTVFQISELIGKERFGTLSEEENEVLEEWRPLFIGICCPVVRYRYPAAFTAYAETNCRLYPSQASPSSAADRWSGSSIPYFVGELLVGSPAVFASATSGRPAHSGRRASCCFTFGKRRTHPFGYLATNDYTRRGQDF